MAPNDGRRSRPLVVLWREALRDDRELQPLEKLVGFVLSTYMSPEGECRPSLATVAKGSGYQSKSEGTRYRVLERINKLEEKGWLRTVRQPRKAIYYVATFPTVPATDTAESATPFPTVPATDTDLSPPRTQPVYKAGESVSDLRSVADPLVREQGLEQQQESATPLRSEAPLRRRLEKKRSNQRQKIASKEKTVLGPDGKTWRVRLPEKEKS